MGRRAPAAERGVQGAGAVGGGEDEDALHVVTHALNLRHQLRLHLPGHLAVVIAPRLANRVELVDEDLRVGGGACAEGMGVEEGAG